MKELLLFLEQELKVARALDISSLEKVRLPNNYYFSDKELKRMSKEQKSFMFEKLKNFYQTEFEKIDADPEFYILAKRGKSYYILWFQSKSKKD